MSALCDPIGGAHEAPPSLRFSRKDHWSGFPFAWKWKVKVNLLSRVQLLAIPHTAAYQAPPYMGFSRLISKWLKNITGFLTLIIHIHSNLCKNFYYSLIKLSINMVLLDIFEHLHLTSTYIFSCIILRKDFPPKVYFNHGNYFLIQWIHFLHL